MTSSDPGAFGGSRERLAAIHAAARQAGAGTPALSAWERWEMGTLDGKAPSGTALSRHTAQRPSPPPASPAPKVDLAELARIRKEARAAGEAEGRAAGLAEGRQVGHTEGLATGLAAASVHAERLRALARSLPEALRGAETELAETVLALALDVARQIVHRTYQAEPEWVLPLVRDLLHAEPALRGEPRLLLHPDDIALVKNSLGSEIEAAGWQLRADDSLARGGCRVQSATGELDASLATRWARVGAALRGDAR
ncbi:flagellar assembly protein FliH [Variovorax sp. 38R]|uniref:flagellar assembly protein FliH n=1 Tax=Variovorax sp. 38R TaxID=2774875 RepID=UPI001782DD0E|nr:flagellar assembly protein FliH [Variovorax sp. 38R]QOF77218.1 flagellar assembly protein FliH [Variovorax sp. 38R]